jgi:hypothetical protein
MLTPDVLSQAGFSACDHPGRLTLLMSTEDATGDSLIPDIVLGASGHFLSDEELEEGTLTVVYDESEQGLFWQFTSPHTATPGGFIKREYPLPQASAEAIRLLRDYLGLDIPLLTVDIGDHIEIVNGCLVKNGQPMVVDYPPMDWLVAVEHPEASNDRSLGELVYLEDGMKKRCDLFSIVGYLA